MIQLATDPTASRTSYRPREAEDGKEQVEAGRRARPGHAWPFISRPAARPVQKDSQKPTANDSGS
jgi:hypothetical protein